MVNLSVVKNSAGQITAIDNITEEQAEKYLTKAEALSNANWFKKGTIYYFPSLLIFCALILKQHPPFLLPPGNASQQQRISRTGGRFL